MDSESNKMTKRGVEENYKKAMKEKVIKEGGNTIYKLQYCKEKCNKRRDKTERQKKSKTRRGTLGQKKAMKGKEKKVKS